MKSKIIEGHMIMYFGRDTTKNERIIIYGVLKRKECHNDMQPTRKFKI